ncbi:MAG: hypothetical protein ICV87_08390, partial [Gemmatimonadetes bacterium]|nr:hypothetical protein [Gemmatimonadota bacterium]
ATLRTAAAGKAQLLADYAAGQRTVGQGERDFLLVPGTDPSRIEALVAHLRRQGIEVESASAGFRAGATPYAGFPARGDFPAGTVRVRARQPLGRLAITLLQPETVLKAEYSYDVSAWSLPYAYGVAAYRTGTVGGSGWTPVRTAGSEPLAAGVQPQPSAFGYLVAPGEQASLGIVGLLKAGGRARVLGKASTFAGRRYPAGTWFVPVRGNDSLRARLARAGLGGIAVPISSGLSEGGIDLGSENVANVRMPRVAVVSGEGVSPTSFGAHWFYLDQQLGLPFDAVQASDLASADLSDYQVIVLPDAAPRAVRDATDALKAWVQRGGRLVAIGGGAEAVAGMAEVKVREVKSDSGANRARFLAGREERERQEWRQEVPGTILPVTLDPAHPLAFGAGLDGRPGETFTLHQGTTVFEPAANLETVAYLPRNPTRISGVISPENLRQLGEGAVVATRRMGQGSVVLFADDPLFRLFWRSMQPLYVNALLIGP